MSSIIESAVRAMNDAAERLMLAPDDGYRPFVAVGEALWWIALVNELLDDAIGQDPYIADREPDPDLGRYFLAFEYVRNRFVHDGDVLEHVEPGAPDAQAYWRWLEQPPGISKRGRPGEREYRELLAGRTVRATLTDYLAVLRTQAVAYYS